MSKKVMMIIGVIVIIAALVAGAYFLFFSKKEINLEEVSSAISTQGGFEEMATTEITTDFYTSYMGANGDNAETIVGKFPLMNVQASMYIIVKAKEGTVEQVKQDLENFGASYEEQWATYLPAQHELVQNRKIGTYGDYAYMIIAENAEELEGLIK